MRAAAALRDYMADNSNMLPNLKATTLRALAFPNLTSDDYASEDVNEGMALAKKGMPLGIQSTIGMDIGSIPQIPQLRSPLKTPPNSNSMYLRSIWLSKE